MTPHIQWTNAAFRELSKLFERQAHKIIQKSDLLRRFPLMGSRLQHRYPRVTMFRQLVIDRKWRLIYGYIEGDETLYILAVQNCRQWLPSAKELARRKLDFE